MSAHDSAEAEACRQLWVAVLAIGAQDVLAPNPPGITDRGNARRAQGAASAWLGSRDFRKVCNLAGVPPEHALARIEARRAALAAGAVTWAQVVDRTASAAGRVASWVRERAPDAVRCAVPGCTATLTARNRSGVCRTHSHAAGLCLCPQCQRGRG
jgi:hypothetical protein